MLGGWVGWSYVGQIGIYIPLWVLSEPSLDSELK